MRIQKQTHEDWVHEKWYLNWEKDPLAINSARWVVYQNEEKEIRPLPPIIHGKKFRFQNVKHKIMNKLEYNIAHYYLSLE